MMEARMKRRRKCDIYVINMSKSSNLKVHIKNNHEGIRFSCDNCNYTATTTYLSKITY